MSDKPRWRSAIEQVDSWVEPQISKAVYHDAFARATGMGYQLRHGLTAEAERWSARVIHALNLPTRSDVNRVLNHVAVVERELQALSDLLDDVRRGEEGDDDSLAT